MFLEKKKSSTGFIKFHTKQKLFKTMLFGLLLICCLIEFCFAHHNCTDLKNDCAQCQVEGCFFCQGLTGFNCRTRSDGCKDLEITIKTCPTGNPNLNKTLPCENVTNIDLFVEILRFINNVLLIINF